MNGRWSRPSRVCLKSTGPGESRLIQSAIASEERPEDEQQDAATTTSNARLSKQAPRLSRVGGRLTSCTPSSGVSLAFGPSASNKRGTMST